MRLISFILFSFLLLTYLYPEFLFASKNSDNFQSKQEIYKEKIVVAKDGTGNFLSLQDAFNSISCYSEKDVHIFIKKGVYHEKIVLYAIRTKVYLTGESRDSTIITFNDYSGKIINLDTLTTHNSYTFRVMADYFEAENITVENTAGNVGQAVAIEIKSDCVAFRNCCFLGNQDTFYANSDGRIFIKNCYIEGTTDFIFGKAIVLFDSCIIHCKKDSYITAASTPENTQFGFVFANCCITADPGINYVYLGRPWRSFAKTVFLNCYLGQFVLPAGWNNWSKPEKEKTIYYAEYKSIGPGVIGISQRVSWSHQLSDSDAANYNIDRIFSKKASNINFDKNWNPNLIKPLKK